MISKLLIPSLAAVLSTGLLGGCVSGYQYRDGAGDYYYGQPQIEYSDYGYGGYGGYGGGPYGYGGGWGGQIGYGYGGYGSQYGYSGYGGYGYPYYPGGPVIIVRGGDRDNDGDADDRGGPAPSNPTSHRPRWGGNLGGERPPLLPSGHVPPPLSRREFPSGGVPSGVFPTRPMPSGGMPSIPRMEQPQGGPIRQRNQDHDGGRILTP
jgi:hypothetical protein